MGQFPDDGTWMLAKIEIAKAFLYSAHIVRDTLVIGYQCGQWAELVTGWAYYYIVPWFS